LKEKRKFISRRPPLHTRMRTIISLKKKENRRSLQHLRRLLPNYSAEWKLIIRKRGSTQTWFRIRVLSRRLWSSKNRKPLRKPSFKIKNRHSRSSKLKTKTKLIR
jgi:hypothetical protein